VSAQPAFAEPQESPRHEDAPRRRTIVTVRLRRRKPPRRVHPPVVAALAVALAILVPLLTYVALYANLTSLGYAIVRAERDRNALIDETQRLDARLARLQAPDRLAALAAKLKMHDPHVYAVVRLPEPQPQPTASGIAFFGRLWAR